MQKKQTTCVPLDLERVLLDLQSPDETVRAKAVRSLCPCHAGWQLFEQHLDLVARLKKDPSPVVRANALHVFEDAGEMQSGGYPTNPREVTNDMLRRKRQARFRLEEEDLAAAKQSKAERHRDGRKARH